MTNKAEAREPSARRDAVQTATRRIGAVARRVPAVAFPQWLRTLVVALLWLGLVPIYASVLAPYVAYNSAQTFTVGLIMSSAIACHLWPTRTAPWRTLAWTAFIVSNVGMILLTAGAGRFALTGATIIGFGFVALRVNQNGRRLVNLVRTWRDVRRAR